MKILIVGNSFGTDAARYLHRIALAENEKFRVVNLYIGGCSLQRHYRNMLSGEDAYDYELNGESGTGIRISLKMALLLDEWDWIFFQQCSPKSGQYESYQPFLSELTAYARRLCPTAHIGLQETWTFAHGCPRFAQTPFGTPEEMLPAVQKAYARAAKDIGADLTIPSLTAVAELYSLIGSRTYRDGFHCNTGVTRLMLGCLWFTALTGKRITAAKAAVFPGDGIPEDDIALACRVAEKTAAEAGLLH